MKYRFCRQNSLTGLPNWYGGWDQPRNNTNINFRPEINRKHWMHLNLGEETVGLFNGLAFELYYIRRIE